MRKLLRIDVAEPSLLSEREAQDFVPLHQPEFDYEPSHT